MTKVAINGFGRIGRLAFRQMFEAEGYEVVAINDLTSPKMLAHLLKYDTAQGGFAGKFGEGKHTVTFKDAVLAEDGKTVVTPGSITVDGKEITIYAKPNAAELPWGELGIDVVLECTGFYTSKAKAEAHIQAGAKKVVISAPAGNDLPTIVYNVNHKTLTPADKVISAASCTTNCLAPMAAALHKYAPIQSGIMSTIHAYTGDQMILDGPQRKGDLRRSRAGAQNIVPNSTGAAHQRGHQRCYEGCSDRELRLHRGRDRFERRYRHEVRFALRCYPDYGCQDRRGHLSGTGCQLVRQREQLHQPDGTYDQIFG